MATWIRAFAMNRSQRKTGGIRRYPIPTRKHPPRRLIPAPPRRRPWYRVLSIVVGLAALGAILALAFLVPALSGCDPFAMDDGARLQKPSPQHWLGTDQFGRDVCSRAFYGGRISLPVGVVAVLTASLPGLGLGLLAGYYGGWVDALVGLATDVMLAFPGILLALLVLAWLGPGLGNAMLAIGLASIPSYIRLARSGTMQVKRAWFVRAARVVGCSDARILTHHILPNIVAPVIVLATLDVGWAILNAAALSFLGLGAQPPTPEWGAMINQGRGFLRQAPWISLAPGGMVILAVLAIQALGDGLRDAMDPRT